MYLQIWSWTALRSLGPEFFTVCNGISTGVDMTFFGDIVPKIFEFSEFRGFVLIRLKRILKLKLTKLKP